jgi:hypothetical protein
LRLETRKQQKIGPFISHEHIMQNRHYKGKKKELFRIRALMAFFSLSPLHNNISMCEENRLILN